MAENTISTAAPPELSIRLAPGVQLPWFREKKEVPSAFSSLDMNTLVAVCNLVLGMKFNFKPPVAQSDSTFQSSAVVNISDQNLVIDLCIAGDGGSGSGVSITDYDPTAEYDQFDIVRIPPTNAASTTQSGGTTIPGVYFAKIVIVPGTPPKHPLQTGGENTSWGWISTWPSVVSGCDQNGNPVSEFADEQTAHT